MDTEPRLLPLLQLVRQTAHDNRGLWRKLDPAYDDSLDFTEFTEDDNWELGLCPSKTPEVIGGEASDDWEFVEVQKAEPSSTVFGWAWLYSEFKILFNYSYMATS